MSVLSMLMSAGSGSPIPKGQVEFTSPGTFNWTVPSGVTSISMVAVGGSGDVKSEVTSSDAATVYCRASWTSQIGDGGGFGGDPGYGGGGAGGYTGKGGNGGGYGQPGGAPLSGSGGGAGGGGTNGAGDYFYSGSGGGGVGLKGRGADGVPVYIGPGGGGSGGQNGGAVDLYAPAPGALYGGGKGASYAGGQSAQRGGALQWKNAVAVTPGSTIRIVVASPNGGVRIIWGAGRSYPSTNTGDV